MNEKDYDDFAICWEQTCVGITGKQPNPSSIEWAFEVLKDKTIEQVRHGLIAHSRDEKEGSFAPKPANIIKHINGAKADKKDYATVAWARVVDNVNRYASVVFDDPAIHYALQVGFGGNWQDVCNFNADDFAYQEKRRSFITAYANYKQGMSYQPYFAGIEEKENGTVNITFIGNQEQAKIVYHGGTSGGLDKLEANSLSHLSLVKNAEMAALR